MKPIGERLSLFAKKKGFKSIRQFEIEADLPNGFVGKSLSITKARQLQIQSAFPDLNMSWVLTGEGEMLRHAPSHNITGNNNIVGNNTGNNTIIADTQAQKSTDSHSKPIVPKYLTSQPNTDVYKILNTDGHTMQLDSMTAIPPYNNFDFYYMVRQDAMKPLYKEGDVLALAHTERGSDIIQGASMIIDTNDFGFLLRRIYDRGDYYECRIINENSSFETQKIAKTKVIRLYRIVYSIRLGD
ncbi:S24 family peptidase [Phocaeicola plebeius]